MMTDVTRILNTIEQGDSGAADELLPLIYEELHILTNQKLSHEKAGQTIQVTALVHEAYIRPVGKEDRNWDSRDHFFATSRTSYPAHNWLLHARWWTWDSSIRLGCISEIHANALAIINITE